MKTQELSTFKKALAVFLGIMTMGIGGNLVSAILTAVMGNTGALISSVLVLTAVLFLSYDRLHNNGMRTYQNIEDPFKRRYVKAMTGNAVFGVVVLVCLIIVFFVGSF